MGFMQNTSPLRNLPTDITLKLSDGTIEAQKMMLAYISPVFEKMFYGKFKETKSKVVDLPNDSHRIMKLLLDIVFEENCEMESLDDIIPLMEAVERYQINKAPVQQMCDEAILAQMNAKNYFILLPKFAYLMSKDDLSNAANKVIKFTNSNFIASCNHAINLPEEVLLRLIQHQHLNAHDLEIFEFLVKWYNHQTGHFGKSLKLTSQIFACVRYTRIIPQILTSRIATCNLIDQQLLSDAYHFIYSSEELSQDRNHKSFSVSIFRKPMGCVTFNWKGFHNVSLVRNYSSISGSDVSGNFSSIPVDKYILKSAPLKNEIYYFRLKNIYLSNGSDLSKLLVAISDASENYLASTPVSSDSIITLYVHGRYAFLKLVEICSNTVVSTLSVTGDNPFSVCICRPPGCFKKVSFSFIIS